MPAFTAEIGMPVRVDLMTTAPRKAERFYRGIFGWAYRNTTPVHESSVKAAQGRRLAMLSGLPVSVLLDAGHLEAADTANAAAEGADARNTGTTLTGTSNTDSTESYASDNQWRVNFHVDSVAGTLAAAEQLGATVVQQATELVDGSTMAVIADPAGALVSLLEQPGEQAFVAAGEPGTPVWFELFAGDDAKFDVLIDFYHELFGWEIAVRSKMQNSTFAVAMAQGAPFAGLISGDANSVGWVAYMGVENIDTAVNKTEELGGSVLVPAQATEFGPVATVADPCGATVVLCEVPVPQPDDSVSESDDLLNIDLSEFQ